MYKESNREFLVIVFLSAVLHLIAILLFVLSKIDSTVKEYKDLIKKRKEARVIFQQPPKRYVPKLVSGAAGPPHTLIPSPKDPASPNEKEKLNQKKIDKPKEKPALPFEKTKLKKPKPFSKKKNKKETVIAEKKEEKLIKKILPQKKIPEKKLTLADVTKNIRQYASSNEVIRPPGSNHIVSVTGKNFGKLTAEQLRYERYASKLFCCMETSLLLLIRKFRFIKKPEDKFLTMEFDMDLKQNGEIAGLKIKKSTGNQQFDRFMIKMIHHASSSFPPLPKFLKDFDVCSVPIRYTVPVAHIPTAQLYSQSTFR